MGGHFWRSGCRKNKDMKVEKALQKYTEYIYRELYDENTGIVYNDAGRDNTWNRLYNYPWLAIFFMESGLLMRLLILKNMANLIMHKTTYSFSILSHWNL